MKAAALKLAKIVDKNGAVCYYIIGNTAQLTETPLPSACLQIFRHLAQILLDRIICFAENAAAARLRQFYTI
ncbi:MAG: hypothetical protein ACI4KA_11525 [Oscillospiraceae bacterium]